MYIKYYQTHLFQSTLKMFSSYWIINLSQIQGKNKILKTLLPD